MSSNWAAVGMGEALAGFDTGLQDVTFGCEEFGIFGDGFLTPAADASNARGAGGAVSAHSSIPMRIARRETPVHRSTKMAPPCPRDCAAAAAQNRRVRSL